MNIRETVEEFENTYGDLQSMYNEWRRQTEQHNAECKQAGEKSSSYCFTDCGFAEARESFSAYCDLKEIIPFDVMFHYENCYPEDEESGK